MSAAATISDCLQRVVHLGMKGEGLEVEGMKAEEMKAEPDEEMKCWIGGRSGSVGAATSFNLGRRCTRGEGMRTCMRTCVFLSCCVTSGSLLSR